MKVLITGCTSQQSSIKTQGKTPTFAGLLSQAFRDGGAAVEVVEPSVYLKESDIAQYDSVIVGIAPPKSLSANKVYSAFSVAEKARKIGNLSLFLDAPEPYKVWASLKSCYNNFSDLEKPFYSKRKEYKEFLNDDVNNQVKSFIEYLYTDLWVKTYYPTFPWSTNSTLCDAIENIDSSKLYGVSVDALILNTNNLLRSSFPNKNYWTCDAPNTEWSKSIVKTLENPVISTRQDKWASQSDTLDRIKMSLGTLVSTYRSGESWWSPALSQSLSCGVPVVTDWRHSASLGDEWRILATTIETMTLKERSELAITQMGLYLSKIPTWQSTVEDLIESIDLEKSSF